jgi:diguanylate cyclase (GGDEF)-like protein
MAVVPRPLAPAPSVASQALSAPFLLAEAPKLIGLLNVMASLTKAPAFFETFWETLAANVPLDAATLWRARPSGGMGMARAFGWRSERPEVLASTLPWEGSLEAYVAACRVPVASADLGADVRFARPESLKAEGFVGAMALPLVVADRVQGVLTVYRRHQAPFSAAEQTVLELSAAMLAQGLEALDQRDRHHDALHVDALTGLASHRAFAERLEGELKRAMRYDLPLSVVKLDLDGFGAYNEANGFTLGDEALKQVAEVLRAHQRAADLTARLDADSFAWLLPECGASDAMALAEQLRLAVAASMFPGRRAGGSRLTASVAVTTQQGGHANRAKLMADLADGITKARQQSGNALLFHASAVGDPA